ncbi:MAG TPA: hypothetical protein VIZ18_02595 [Ktedonobacteraceae bacterium]
MKQNENEEAQDDLELEITSLDDVEGDTPLVARLPKKSVLFLRRHRKLATFATTGFVALAILLILFSIAPIRQQLFPPGQQTTFSYHLDADPLWGQLFVDGQAVSVPSDRSYPLFSLTRGQHTLMWRADPFPPQQCTLTVPVESGIDTCKHPPIPPGSDGTDSYISFPTDITLLSLQQRNALLQATRAAFDRQQSSETVRAGELYAQTNEISGPSLPSPSCTVLQTAALCLADAHQTLKATLRLQLDTTSSSRVSCDDGACSSEGQNCHLFCAPFAYNAPDLPVSPAIWSVNVNVQLFWQFTTLQGQVIADNQADTFIRGQTNDISVPLNITWDGEHWSVSIARIGDYVYASDPVCAAAMSDLYNLESAVPATTAQDTQTSMNPIQGTTFASGCLIEFELQNNAFRTTTPNVSPPLVADIMQRFGVLLAVNDVAHRLFPFLPVATAYEMKLAQQWTILQPGGASQSAFVTVSGA